MTDSLCFILVLTLCVGLVVHGFMQLLKKQGAGESDAQVTQRQLRGFAYLILAQIVLVLGMALCVGLNLDGVKKMIKAARV